MHHLANETADYARQYLLHKLRLRIEGKFPTNKRDRPKDFDQRAPSHLRIRRLTRQ